MQMLNGAEKEVIQRKYQQFRQANSFASAVQLTAKWAENTHAVPRAETRQVIYRRNNK
mgnify:FL=1|jgi:hypothetical protein